MKIGLLFAGQGSQSTDMAADFLNFAYAKKLIKEANEILGYNVEEALLNKSNELDQTLYTQPLLLITSILIYEYFKEKNIKVDAALGFSLGEYTALYAAGVYEFKEILAIVNERAILMEEASRKNEGMMAAVISDNKELIESISKKHSSDTKYVGIANYNAKNQYVITGNKNEVLDVIEELKENKIRKIFPLSVSGGFHSKLMEEASNKLFNYLNLFNEKENKFDIYLNVTAGKLNIKNLKENLQNQIKSPVLFYQSVENMIKEGINVFIEIGPGSVLSNLIKKNYENLKVISLKNLEDFKLLGETL